MKDAAVAAIAAGETKYTPVNGTPALREAIRGSLRRTVGVDYADTELTVGGGGKQVIFLAFMASLDAGDEVLIPAPYWVSYPDMVRVNEGIPVTVPTAAEDGYVEEWQDLARLAWGELPAPDLSVAVEDLRLAMSLADATAEFISKGAGQR